MADSAVRQAAKQIQAYSIEHGTLPTNLDAANIDSAVGSATITYSIHYQPKPRWCIAATVSEKISASISSSSPYDIRHSGCDIAPDQAYDISSPGTMEGVATVIFVGRISGGGSQYSLDLRPAINGFSYRPANGRLGRNGPVTHRQEGDLLIAYTTAAPQKINVGQRHSRGEKWQGGFRAIDSSKVLSPNEIENVIKQIKASI